MKGPSGMILIVFLVLIVGFVAYVLIGAEIQCRASGGRMVYSDYVVMGNGQILPSKVECVKP